MRASADEVIDDVGTQRLTAAAALDGAARFVGGLAERQVPGGSRLLFCAPSSAHLLCAVLGSLLAGYLPVVVSDRLTARERDELTVDVEPALVVDANHLRTASDAAPVALGGHLRCRPMHFTSGTSGRPKGVWSGWLDERLASALLDEERAAWGITPADTHLVCAPLSHSAPLRFALVTLMAGGTVVIPRAFVPEVVSGLVESGTATTTFMAPVHLQRVLETCPPARADMRLVAHAGSACPGHVRREARATFGDAALREFYGSTEGQFTICTPAEHDRRPGTVGRARPGRALRVGPDGRIWCRVPEHARFEYWRDPEKTAETWDGDWFTVGDLGRLDDDGYLFLDGRRSDLIISGGVNVYPAEIERVVLDVPGVRQAIAFGAADPSWGQRVCLAVVGDVRADDVLGHCARVLAPAKRPKSVHLVADLPLTHSGKVDRLRLPRWLGLAP